jgi:branched-chain amino acid transport system substrate-binding protein
MEKLTKRILAIVLIAVIGIGVGVTVWIFVAPYSWGSKDCPGAPSGLTEDQIIRIGVMGDTERIHGEGQLWGAQLAARELNEAGGIVVDGKRYYYGITSENTDEANPMLDITKAVAAGQRIINYKRVQLATGGFRTESLLAYRDLFMEAAIPFINTGAATTTFCQSVLDDYDTYKYFFQNNPINSTALAIELIKLIITTAIVQYYASGFAIEIRNFAIVRENLAWTAGFADLMIGALTNNDKFNLTFTDVNIAIPQDVGSTEMASHWSKINGNRTQIVIPIISGEAGLIFTTSYATAKPNCTIFGINVISQDAAYWDLTNGACEYGTTLESLFKTNKTSKTIAMWDAYEARFGTTPIYTAAGSYDAIYQYHYAINTTGSFSSASVVAGLETLTRANTLEGSSGYVAFDSSHCTVEGWPYGVALALQWIDGTKRLVPGIGVYPSGSFNVIGAPPLGSLANMEPFRLPSWGIFETPT